MALHAGLTGADLHEPKGVASATINKVYVSDGAGSGSWSVLPFSHSLLHVRDQRSSGTNGQILTAASYQTREIQTVVTNEISGASLASHQITLPAGTYFTDIRCTSGIVFGSGFSTIGSVVRLRDTTNSLTLLTGIGVEGTVTSGSTAYVHTLSGRFTLAGACVLELQDYFNTPSGAATLYGGLAHTTGEDEVYADVLIWKIT